MREKREIRLQLKTMALAVVTMVMVILMLGMTTLVSHAEEGRVTASSVKIRENADTDSEMISGAMQGDILTITGEVTGADGRIWYQVTFDGSRTGYIRSDLMEKVSGSGTSSTTGSGTASTTPASDVEAVQPVSARVIGEQVRVRSDASTSGSIVTTVQRDVVLTVTGTASDSEGKVWYQVSFSDASGQVTGFVRQDFVSLEGELVPADQVSQEPETPDTEEPAADEEPVQEQEHKDFETQLEEDGWYLLDYTSGNKYSIEEIFDTAEKNAELYEQSQERLRSMRIIMIVLVVVVILLALATTLLFFKIRDMMDAAYFEEVEQETIRKRQGQRAANRATMPTVGAGKQSSPGQSKPAGGQQTRAAGGQKRPAAGSQARPAGSGQQARAAGGQTKPAGSAQKPAGSQAARPAQPASKPVQPTSRPAQSASKPAPQARPAQSSAKPAQQTSQNAAWQSKNFMADDDEFEFEFLNWDGEEDN